VDTDSNGQYIYGPVNFDGHPILPGSYFQSWR
jgi:hypothetical protein